MKTKNEEKLLSSIFNVGRLIKEEMYKCKCLTDFTQIEIEVLKLVEKEKSITMKAIADYLHIKPSSATPVINKLVKTGNLKRIENKGDRRVVYILSTKKGLKSLQKKYKNIHNTVGKIFSKLNNKDKEALIKIFNKIHENIN